MIQPGRYEGAIIGTRIDQKGSKGTSCLVVDVQLAAENDPVECVIWLTERSMNIARQQIKALGFDIDTRDLAELHETNVVAGKTVTVKVVAEEYKGRVQMKYEIATLPPNTRDLTAALRAAGSEASRSRQPSGDAPMTRGSPPARMPGDGVREAGRSAREDAARMPPPPARPATPKLPDFGSPDDLDGVPF